MAGRRGSGWVCVGFCLLAVSARAADIDVTRFDDPDPAGPGKGSTSLRQAILLANSTEEPDTITLHIGTYRLTIRGDDATALAGDLDVSSTITIEGDAGGATIIDAKKAKDRAFEVLDGGDLTLRHVTVRGGSALVNGGAVMNVGALTVESSTLTGNKAGDSGGAIASAAGTCTLTDDVVTKNKASNDGGGLNFAVAGTASLTRVTLASNTAADTGGGMNSDDGVTVSVSDSTISGNKSKREGGGLDPSGGVLNLTNTTISGNHSAKGGGIQLEAGGVVTLDNVTIAHNSAREGAGLWTEVGSTITLTNTLVAKNSPFDCFGLVVSNGSNLIGRVDGCGIGGDTTGDIVGGPKPLKPVDPRLGPLSDNALLAGSPAINAVQGTCPPPAADQRGLPRTGTCDIGAFEAQ
jgi:predicted outer membrane repeat protein